MKNDSTARPKPVEELKAVRYWSFPVAKKSCGLLLILLLWLLCLAITHPLLANFPLSDDWSYAKVVQHLLATGEYRYTGWESVTLVSHVLWGALFCLPLSGFSFAALHLSTLVMAALSIATSWLLAREVRPDLHFDSALAAALVAFNPLFFVHCHTFMTDISFMALFLGGVFFGVRCLRFDKSGDLALAAALCIAATLGRQCGLAVAVAFAVAYPLRYGLSWRKLGRALIPLALSFAAMFVCERWLSTGHMPVLHNEQMRMLTTNFFHPGRLTSLLSWNLGKVIIYLGLFLSPLLLPFFFGGGKKKVLTFAFVALLISGWCWQTGNLMPLLGNVLKRSGFGPLSLRDTSILHQNVLPSLPDGFWLAVTVLGVVAGLALIARIVPPLFRGPLHEFWPGRMPERRCISVFLLLTVLIYLAPILMLNRFFDRYTLPLLPLLAACLLMTDSVKASSVAWRSLAITLSLAFMVFSVAGTHDYLAWNGCRWAALTEVQRSKGIAADVIDGGFEFNGWTMYQPRWVKRSKKSWWWVKGDDFLVSFSRQPGYVIWQSYPYRRWLPPGQGVVLMLEKTQPHSVWVERERDKPAMR